MTIKRQQLYEGKAKIVYTTDDSDILVAYFKDDATAFNAQKRGTILDKGHINCAVSTHLFQLLEAKGIATHWIDTPSEREMLIKPVKIVPLEVVVRNYAAGSLCRQTGLEEGTELNPPLVEFYYKNDDLGDPLLTLDRLRVLQLASQEQVELLKRQALMINQYLSDFFAQCQITLVDFKLEFGLDSQGQMLLADEISPDTCRLWDQSISDPKQRILDKDRFRQDLGGIEAAYQQVLRRVLAQTAE